MNKNLYVIYDLVSKSVYSPVMSADTDELMMRDVRTAKLGEIIESNLADFDLVKVGTIDLSKGEIISTEHTLVCHFDTLKGYGRKTEN